MAPQPLNQDNLVNVEASIFLTFQSPLASKVDFPASKYV